MCLLTIHHSCKIPFLYKKGLYRYSPFKNRFSFFNYI
nr:MAG TPA: hypothetical protein [Caudoviricetes sp.]